MLSTLNFHPDYTATLPELKKIRRCVKGAFFIKRKEQEYLPHPNKIDSTSEEQQERYDTYIAGAEFDEIPGQTLRSYLGKINAEDTAIELPDQLEYLVQSVDGDGLSMVGLLNSCSSWVMQFKWHVLVADYQGLSSLDLEQVSAADIEAANPRATIKEYNRENVVDWHFDRIDGKMQLTYIMLREVGEQFNQSSLQRSVVESFLILALDEDGNYYQKKLVRNSDSGYEEGEPSYISVGGSPLTWLPVEIVSDEEFISGSMPQEFGMLNPVCDKTLSRYRVSADYKEFTRKLVPTTHVTGINESAWEQFKAINGRSYIAQGGVNVWPDGAQGSDIAIEIIGADASNMSGFTTFFDKNEKEIRALGGVFPSDNQKQRTATEVMSEAEDDTARLNTLVSSIEQAVKRMCLYCGMFEGLYQPDNIEQSTGDIIINMPRGFASQKMSVEEVKALMEIYMSGLMPKEETLKVLEVGGWTLSKVEDLMSALESEGMQLTPPT